MIASRQCRTWVVGAIILTLPQLLPGAEQAELRINRSEVERVKSGIRGAVYIVDWHGTWDFTTIQAALNAADDGDTVIVLPSSGSQGTAYIENIFFPARAITLRSLDPEDPAVVAATIIDGDALGSVVRFAEGTPRQARLMGFTLRHGTGSGGGPYGGGIYMQSASPAISHNTITDNHAVYGGGLYVISSSPDIIANTITNNTAQSLGGGLYLLNSDTLITENDIEANMALDSASALYVEMSTPSVTRNFVLGNIAGSGSSDPTDGAAILAWWSSPFLWNNAVVGNAAEGEGGALCLVASSWPALYQNTIVNDQGYGVYLVSSSADIFNTIVAFNSVGIVQDGSGTDQLVYNNCVFGNPEQDYVGMVDMTGIQGNISADPRFLRNPSAARATAPGNNDRDGDGPDYGDLRLRPESPCIDGGHPEHGWDDIDLAGHTRFVDGDWDGEPTEDIGAYEYLPADLDDDGAVDLADYTLWADCLTGPGGAHPQGCLLADLDADGDVDLADFARFGRVID